MEESMVAGVLIKVEPTKTKSAYERIKSIEGVSNITAVFGRFDLVVMIRALDMDAAGKLISKIRGVDGVLSTETLIATTVE
jgi:nitrate reductase NapAB chaperone NapD